MIPKTEKDFLGTGWSFPPAFDIKTRGVKLVSSVEDINDSLSILLSTRLGERIMLPDYGCNLDELIFENLDTTMETFLTELIRTAILYHEPRIDLEAVDYIRERVQEGVLLLDIQYKVRITNSRANFVFPYYQEEGTNL